MSIIYAVFIMAVMEDGSWEKKMSFTVSSFSLTSSGLGSALDLIESFLCNDDMSPFVRLLMLFFPSVSWARGTGRRTPVGVLAPPKRS